MAVTVKSNGLRTGGIIERQTEAGSANATLASTTTGSKPKRLMMVAVKYSAAPTQAGVTVELDSGAGAGFDTTLNTGAANAQSTVYIPTTEIWVSDDDQFLVTAPAGGAGIAARVSVYLEVAP